MLGPTYSPGLWRFKGKRQIIIRFTKFNLVCNLKSISRLRRELYIPICSWKVVSALINDFGWILSSKNVLHLVWPNDLRSSHRWVTWLGFNIFSRQFLPTCVMSLSTRSQSFCEVQESAEDCLGIWFSCMVGDLSKVSLMSSGFLLASLLRLVHCHLGH